MCPLPKPTTAPAAMTTATVAATTAEAEAAEAATAVAKATAVAATTTTAAATITAAATTTTAATITAAAATAAPRSTHPIVRALQRSSERQWRRRGSSSSSSSRNSSSISSRGSYKTKKVRFRKRKAVRFRRRDSIKYVEHLLDMDVDLCHDLWMSLDDWDASRECRFDDLDRIRECMDIITAETVVEDGDEEGCFLRWMEDGCLSVVLEEQQQKQQREKQQQEQQEYSSGDAHFGVVAAVRGLENRLTATLCQRRQGAVQNVRNAVLGVQDFQQQWRLRQPPHSMTCQQDMMAMEIAANVIAEASMACSQTSRIIAVQVGMQDARQVAIMTKQDERNQAAAAATASLEARQATRQAILRQRSAMELESSAKGPERGNKRLRFRLQSLRSLSQRAVIHPLVFSRRGSVPTAIVASSHVSKD